MQLTEARQKAKDAVARAYALMPAQGISRYRVNRKLYEEVLAALLASLGDIKGKRILDVGAGRGTLALAIRLLGAETFALEKYVFDHSESEMFREGGEGELLKIWREQGVTPLVEDIFAMDTVVPAGSIDGVVSVEVIEHVKSPKEFLEQISRVLASSGSVVIATPNYGRLHARIRLLAGANPKLDLKQFYDLGDKGFVGHWREYLPSELEDMLRWSGFANVSSTTFCDPWYAIQKKVDVYSIKQMMIHLLSYLLPRAKYEAMVVGKKPSA